jgi:hypothetical protein
LGGTRHNRLNPEREKKRMPKHAYVVGPGGLTKAVAHLRKSFPPSVTATTLTKLGIAKNNESYVVNTLRFLGVLDDKGARTTTAQTVFSKHADPEFQEGLAAMVATAYSDLFDLHGAAAWTLPSEQLISFFRGSDNSSALVGQRQASTFQALAGLAGKAQKEAAKKDPAKPALKKANLPTAPKPATAASNLPKLTEEPASLESGKASKTTDVGLTVRIEINLPAVADQATYDAIFASIRKNFIDAQ